MVGTSHRRPNDEHYVTRWRASGRRQYGAETNQYIIFGTLQIGERMRCAPILRVVFFASEGGREPVRAWLRELSRHDRQTIGAL